MFQSRTAVHIGGPTGAASFNAGGVAVHCLFGITTQNQNNCIISSTKQEELLESLKDTVALLIDECSMISLKLLSQMHFISKMYAHKGFFQEKSWGGIPIVILIGDDYQLPSVEFGPLFIPLPGSLPLKIKFPISLVSGAILFKQFGETTMDL